MDLQDLLQKGVSTKVFPGAQAAARKNREPIHVAEAGREWLPGFAPPNSCTVDRGGPPIARRTLFDVASLTKPLVTAALVMKLVDQNQLTFNTPVSYLLKCPDNWSSITVGHLMAHSSGLPALIQFFKTLYSGSKSWLQIEEEVRQTCLSVPLNTLNTYTYSDLGYILLYQIIEKISGQKVASLAKKTLFEPAGLTDTCFANSDNPIPIAVAATEACTFRNRVLAGVVHDENAWSMGGLSGHAGLFSTASEVLRLTECILGIGDLSLLSPKTLKQALNRNSIFCAGSHVLGWDTPSGPQSSAGSILSRETTVGHLGFTGCSVWADLSSEPVIIVLLTNRVHPSRDNIKIKQYRPWFHDSVATGLQTKSAECSTLNDR